MLLVVDDDAALGVVLVGLLTQAGHEAVHVESAAHALDRLARSPVELVVTDLRMPGMDGMGLLDAMQRTYPDIPVIVLTAHGTVATAVDAMKRGAVDFLVKPFDRPAVLETVDRALRRPLPDSPPDAKQTRWIGEAPEMERLEEQLGRVAATTATVLLRGETGSGKELLARAIHDRSPRSGAPFVVVNCAALPDSLLESELFGHEKGAFTGATHAKPGRVELADGGTLFLDEIGEMPLAMQAKLLRFLQEREVQRVGGEGTRTVDVRFVSATHRDLEAMIADGSFREDLFYRLGVVPLEVPPLRERGGDVRALALHFLREVNVREQRSATLTEDALVRLETHRWPGNVRELSHLVERLVILTDGVITGAEVSAALASRPGGAPALGGELQTLAERRAAAERTAIEEALAAAKGNRTVAARLLGVSRRTLYNKLEELQLE